MPLFLVNARDKADALPLRMANRPEHLAWAAGFKDQMRMGGPVFADDGETFVGSAFVMEMDSLEDVRHWAAADPYAKAGLFETVEIRPFTWAIGDGKA